MKFIIELIDNERGIQLTMQQQRNGVQDFAPDSLSAMWASKIYMMFEEAKTKGHTRVLIDDERIAIH